MFSSSPGPENATFHPSPLPPNLASSISAVIIDVLLVILGTLGNLLVLLVILLNIRLATASNLLLANLALIDFICMFLLVPGGIYKYLCRMGFCHVPQTFVLAHRALAQFIVAAAVSSLFAIAVDRTLSIKFSFKYTSIMTKRRAIVFISLTWILGAVISFIFMVLKFIYVQPAYCSVLIMVTIFLYIHIFLIALKKERQIANLQITNVQRNTNFLHERKSTKTMAIILGVFCAAWIPAVVFYAVVSPNDPRYFNIQNWINTIYYLNASLNPFVYCVRSVNFRKRIKKLMKSSMVRFGL